MRLEKPKLEQAFRKFDRVERNSLQWKGWEEQPGHEFVLYREREERIYPLRHILALAMECTDNQIEELEALNAARNTDYGLKVVSIGRYLQQVARREQGRKQPLSKTVSIARIDVLDSQLFNPSLLQIRITKFKEMPHKSFTNEFYLNDERNFKLDASKLLYDQFGEKGEKLKNLIEQKKFKEAADKVRAMYQKDNLLYKPWEVLPFIHTEDELLINRLYNLLYGTEDFSTWFKSWIDLLGKDNPLCWPAATYHLMLHKPNEHIFVKPGPIGRFLKAVGSKLVWQPRTNAAFYAEIQRFAYAILPELKPLGARDMIDVQSFIWVLRELE